MIVILGAFGRTGRVVAERAVAAGADTVRRVTRQPGRESAETEYISGDASLGAAAGGAKPPAVEVARVRRFDDDELGRVLRRARALYAILPDDLSALRFHAERRAMAEAIAHAIERERVPRVVLLSSRLAALGEGSSGSSMASMGSTGPSDSRSRDGAGDAAPSSGGLGADLAYFERRVLDTRASVTVLRASYFQDNLVAQLSSAARDGIYPDFLPPDARALTTIAAGDVGAFAARELLRSASGTREVIDLVGPEYTTAEIAAALADAVGRPVSAQHVAPAAQLQWFERWMSPEAARAMVETFRWIGSERLSASGERVERGTTRLESVLQAARASVQPREVLA